MAAQYMPKLHGDDLKINIAPNCTKPHPNDGKEKKKLSLGT